MVCNSWFPKTRAALKDARSLPGEVRGILTAYGLILAALVIAVAVLVARP